MTAPSGGACSTLARMTGSGVASSRTDRNDDPHDGDDAGGPDVGRMDVPAADALTDGERRALWSVAAHLGSSLSDASRVAWGDSRSSYRMVLADGRVVAARYLTGPGSQQRAQALVRRSDLLAASGIAVAGPARLGPGDDLSAWILTPWMDGVVGAMALGTRRSSLELADQMGRLAARIASVDTDGLHSNRAWATPDDLDGAASGWLAALQDAIDPETSLVAKKALDDLTDAWDSRAPWQVGMSHGDFAPINVIIGLAGDLIVLDLDDVQPGPRLLDVAWWGWVVGHHHPIAWARTWSTFVQAAGFEPGPGLDAAATAVARVRLLERAARAPDTRGRSLWLHRLDQTRDRRHHVGGT